ncbi:MAG TPA: response regulator [Thermodesulfobacteriaceae bacterium]|nr:response regulator [Thermodesulfobacteriaceae bacterium]
MLEVFLAQQTNPVKTLVVDDTAFMRRALVEILSRDPDIEVVGVAKHGREALEAIEVLDPDVITLDVDMPVMDGLTAIKHIMVRGPKPIIMVSGLAGHGRVTFEALKLGAVDFFPKPSGTISPDMERRADELGRVVKQAARLNPRGIVRARLPHQEENETAVPQQLMGVVVVAAQRGTSSNLIKLLSHVSSSLPLSIIALQDISLQVLESYSAELDRSVSWTVNTNQDCSLAGGDCLLSSMKNPWHFRKGGDGNIHVAKGQKRGTDDFFREAALYMGSRCLAVVLGGENDDGVSGLVHVREKGGGVLVLEPGACVYGEASRAVLEAGAGESIPSEPELWRKVETFGRRLLLESLSAVK